MVGLKKVSRKNSISGFRRTDSKAVSKKWYERIKIEDGDILLSKIRKILSVKGSIGISLVNQFSYSDLKHLLRMVDEILIDNQKTAQNLENSRLRSRIVGKLLAKISAVDLMKFNFYFNPAKNIEINGDGLCFLRSLYCAVHSLKGDINIHDDNQRLAFMNFVSELYMKTQVHLDKELRDYFIFLLDWLENYKGGSLPSSRWFLLDWVSFVAQASVALKVPFTLFADQYEYEQLPIKNSVADGNWYMAYTSVCHYKNELVKDPFSGFQQYCFTISQLYSVLHSKSYVGWMGSRNHCCVLKGSSGNGDAGYLRDCLKDWLDAVLQCIHPYMASEYCCTVIPDNVAALRTVPVPGFNDEYQMVEGVVDAFERYGDIPFIELPVDVLGAVHCKLRGYDTIPNSVLAKYVHVANVLLTKGLEGLKSGNQEIASSHFKKFLLLPVVVISKFSFDKDSSVIKNMMSRLDRVIQGDWDMFTYNNVVSKDVVVVPDKKYNVDGFSLSSNELKSWKYMEKGLISKAFNALSRKRCVLPHEDIYTQLKSLHPSGPEVTCSPLVALNVQFTADELWGYIRSRKRSISPGLNQWSIDMLYNIRNLGSVGKQFYNLLSNFISNIANATLPSDILRYLSHSFLVPIPKNNDLSSVRPIAMSDTFRKIAAAILIKRNSYGIIEYFGNDQVGVCKKCGIDYIHKMCQLATNANPDYDVIALDAKNAFNTAYRAPFLESVYTNFHSLYNLVATFYGKPTWLFAASNDEVMALLSSNGVQQGDPLGPLLFSLAMHPVLLKAKASLDNEGIIKAYLDDMTIVANIDKATAAIQIVKDEGSARGYFLNPQKCKILIAANVDSTTLNERMRKYCDVLGITLAQAKQYKIFVHKDLQEPNKYGIQLLGIPFGSDEYIMNQLTLKLEEYMQDLLKIISFPDPQKSWLMLHYVMGNKCNFLLRAIPPHLAENFVVKFNSLLQSGFQQIMQVPMDDNVALQLCLPISDGGFGLRFWEDVSVSAFVGAAIDIYDICISDDYVVYKNLADNALINIQHIVASVSKFTVAGELVLSDIVKKCMDDKVPHCQHIIYEQLVKIHKEKFIKESDFQFEQLRKVSVQEPETGAFLLATPYASCKFSAYEFRLACIARLGLPYPFISQGTSCICAYHSKIDEHGWHFNLCPKGNERIQRHNGISKELVKLATTAGVKCISEPIECFPFSDTSVVKRTRPDIRLCNVGNMPLSIKDVCNIKDILVDVSIVHASSARAMAYAANEKNSKFRRHAIDNNMWFFPLIMDHYGKWNKDMKNLVHDLCQKIYLSNPDSLPLSRVFVYWNRRLSVTFHRLQAQLVLKRWKRVVEFHQSAGKVDESSRIQIMLDSNV